MIGAVRVERVSLDVVHEGGIDERVIPPAGAPVRHPRPRALSRDLKPTTIEEAELDRSSVRVSAGSTCGPAIVTRNAVRMTMLQLVAAVRGVNLRRI